MLHSMPKSTQTPDFQSIASNDQALGSIYDRSLEILQLQKAIRNQIDKPLSEHIFVGTASNHQLIIYTDSAAWASRIRYLVSQILAIVNDLSANKPISSVRVRVDPALRQQETTPVNLSMSTTSSQHLENVAKNIGDDKLSTALLNLAKNK